MSTQRRPGRSGGSPRSRGCVRVGLPRCLPPAPSRSPLHHDLVLTVVVLGASGDLAKVRGRTTASPVGELSKGLPAPAGFDGAPRPDQWHKYNLMILPDRRRRPTRPSSRCSSKVSFRPRPRSSASRAPTSPTSLSATACALSSSPTSRAPSTSSSRAAPTSRHDASGSGALVTRPRPAGRDPRFSAPSTGPVRRARDVPAPPGRHQRARVPRARSLRPPVLLRASPDRVPRGVRVPAPGVRGASQGARGQLAADHCGEALWEGRGVERGAFERDGRAVRRAHAVPDRPLPGEGARAEHGCPAVRQHLP